MTREEDIKRGIENPQGFASYWTIIAFEELRKTLHALWMARAYNGFNATYNLTSYHNYMIEHPDTKVTLRRWYHCWKLVERKCLEKAKEFE